MHRFPTLSAARRAAILVSATTLLAGCGGGDQGGTDTADTAAPPVGAMTPAATSIAVPAGNWQGRSMPMDRDTVVATWTMTTTADSTGWTITFPGGQPIPMRVLSMQGDSVTIEFGPYESTTGRGRQTVRGVSRMQGDRMVGTYEARPVATPDSVYRGRSEATRMP
jgi:hypothetical protein